MAGITQSKQKCFIFKKKLSSKKKINKKKKGEEVAKNSLDWIQKEKHYKKRHDWW